MRFRPMLGQWLRRSGSSRLKFAMAVFLLLAYGLTAALTGIGDAQPASSLPAGTSLPAGRVAAVVSGELSVHILNVGKADCILIRQGDSAMLIDAGNNDDADLVTTYLDVLGIRKLAIVVGTHPHEDHIGSLDTVIRHYAVDRVILPATGNSTDSYADLVQAIADKGLGITRPVPGQTFTLGQAEVLILGPVLDAEDLNDTSVVCKVTFGGTAFLFAGDANADSEQAMIAGGYDLQADVLKVGHHGSSAATSKALLQAVRPDYAVISCNIAENAGLPADSTLVKLESAGIRVYRTDVNGTVIAVSDGQNLSFSFRP